MKDKIVISDYDTTQPIITTPCEPLHVPQYSDKVKTALKLQELVKDKITLIKKHLENIERQEMTGRNLGHTELTSGDYVFMAKTKLTLKSELKEWLYLIEQSQNTKKEEGKAT